METARWLQTGKTQGIAKLSKSQGKTRGIYLATLNGCLIIRMYNVYWTIGETNSLQPSQKPAPPYNLYTDQSGDQIPQHN